MPLFTPYPNQMPAASNLYAPLLSIRYYLLDNAITRAISKYLSPRYLLIATEVMVVAIALVVLAIYLYLFFKKRTYFYTRRIRKHLEPLISHIIMEESMETMVIPAKFYKIINNPVARQFAIDELIKCKKNFSGEVAQNVVTLYLKLGLKKFSLKKIASKKKWHVKARGIQELYQMDQRDVLKTIYHNTNSRNRYVRMEAQTGVIHLTGFPGLRFLDVASYPITEWQQLKLLEQLRLYPDKEDFSKKLPNWLKSKNDTVVVFALKLADDYQQYAVHKEVVACLLHPSVSVRSQAIKTIVRLENEETPAILVDHFDKATLNNQFFILDSLRNLATAKEAPFFVKLLDHENDTIKLKAALVMANCCDTGLEILEQKGIEQPELYYRIYRHVKTVK